MDALPEVSQHLLPLGIALALGLMIGLERGWSSRGMEHGTRVAGVRTYGLIGLLGGISGLIALETTRFFPGLVFLGLAAALITARVQAGDAEIAGALHRRRRPRLPPCNRGPRPPPS